MNEPKIIDREEAARLWARGDDRVRIRLAVLSVSEWAPIDPTSGVGIFRDPDYEFALIDPEPAIVKPVVLALSTNVVISDGRENSSQTFYRFGEAFPDGPLVVTIRPEAQQEERDRLEREFVKWSGMWEDHGTPLDKAAIALRDFIKKEQA